MSLTAKFNDEAIAELAALEQSDLVSLRWTDAQLQVSIDHSTAT